MTIAESLHHEGLCPRSTKSVSAVVHHCLHFANTSAAWRFQFCGTLPIQSCTTRTGEYPTFQSYIENRLKRDGFDSFSIATQYKTPKPDRAAPSLAIGNKISTEIFDTIASYANEQNPMQAIRSLLLGFYPLSRDLPAKAERMYTTIGSSNLRGSRHWGTFVLDTAHSRAARDSLAAQMAQWRFLSSADGESLDLKPLTLRFYNFDFASGEQLAYFDLPYIEMMTRCHTFEFLGARGDKQPTVMPVTPRAASRRRRTRQVFDLTSTEFRSSVDNSPLRWLRHDTALLSKLLIDVGRPYMPMDGDCADPSRANTFLPVAPRLKSLIVTGSLSPRLFHLSNYPLLEHFSFDAVVTLDVLHTLADNCPNLRFLRVGLCPPDEPSEIQLHFPNLETVVADASYILQTIGFVDVSPRLSTILIADDQNCGDYSRRIFGRGSICIVGPWRGGRPSAMSRGVISALMANNDESRNIVKVSLVIEDFLASELWSFLESWVDNSRWPTVAAIVIRNCTLTATISLAICDLAATIVVGGGTLKFRACRGNGEHAGDEACASPIHDVWEEAVAVEGRKRLAHHNVAVEIL